MNVREVIEKEWTKAARRRLEEMQSGSVRDVSGDEVFEKIWNKVP